MNSERDIWEKVSRENVYTVPEGYFDNLSSDIMSTIILESGKQHAQQGPYTTPDNYFQSLPAAILAKLEAADTGNVIFPPVETIENHLQTEETLLATIGKANPYSIPPDYFEQLPVKVLSKATGEVRGKTVSMRSISRRWIPYAAAAAISGFMVLGALIFNNDGSQQSTSSHNKNFSAIDVKQGVSDLSESEINGYLSTHPAIFDIRSSSAAHPVEAEIQRSIKYISEEEITDYLQDNIEPGESPLKGI